MTGAGHGAGPGIEATTVHGIEIGQAMGKKCKRFGDGPYLLAHH